MLKIRIEGLPDEVDALARELGKIAEVLQESDPHKNRGASLFVRKYLDVKLIPEVEKNDG